MTNEKAINRLFNGWLTFALALVILLIFQSLAGKYDADWAIPVHWAFAIVAPSLTLLIAARSNKGKPKWRTESVDQSNYRLAFYLSIVVWAGTAAIFVYEGVGARSIYEILPITGLALTFVQAFIIRAIASIAFANR